MSDRPWTVEELVSKFGPNHPMVAAARARLSAKAARHEQEQVKGLLNDSDGKKGEKLVISTLALAGIPAVKLETGWKGIPVPAPKLEGWHGMALKNARPKAKVLGDIIGTIPPNGRLLFLECKRTQEPVLSWGYLDDHQITNLTTWTATGAWCGVAWVHCEEINVMRWPVDPGVWRSGLTLKLDVARRLNALPQLTGTRRLIPPT